jgi:inosine-uridine nucleoside N-ribohydrolase
LLVYFAETYRQVFGFAAPPVHDPCAVAAVIDSTIIAVRDMPVVIETTGLWTRGRTVCDIYGKLDVPTNVSVGQSLDAERFWKLVLEVLQTYE